MIILYCLFPWVVHERNKVQASDEKLFIPSDYIENKVQAW